MAYSSRYQQNMDTKWQLARKVDRLDLGDIAAIPFFFRNAIIFGFVRAINPKEPDGDDEKDVPGKPIPELIMSMDDRINRLLEFDTTAIVMGKSQLEEAQEFQKMSMSLWFENAEVITRCRLTDNVRVQEEPMP